MFQESRSPEMTDVQCSVSRSGAFPFVKWQSFAGSLTNKAKNAAAARHSGKPVPAEDQNTLNATAHDSVPPASVSPGELPPANDAHVQPDGSMHATLAPDSVPVAGGKRKSMSVAMPTYRQLTIDSAKKTAGRQPVDDSNTGNLSSPFPLTHSCALATTTDYVASVFSQVVT